MPYPKSFFFGTVLTLGQDHDNFIQAAKRTPVDLEAWAVEMMQKANRKSHLQAPLSPATQALLRSDGPFSGGHSPGRDTSNSKTPVSADIPTTASTNTSISTAPSSYDPDPGVQRVMSAEVNGNHGASGYSSQHHHSQRPTYPPRTSSSSMIPNERSRDREHDRQPYIQPTTMPIRPAPPPGGPLPPPPGRDGVPRRHIYPYGQEGTPI